MHQRHRRLRVAVATVAVALAATMLPHTAHAAPPAPAAGGATVTGTDQGAGVLVYLRDQADLTGAAEIAGSAARAEFVYKQLTRTAERSQRALRAELDAARATYRPYWISNVIWVKGDQLLTNKLAARKDVARIEPAGTRPLITPVRTQTASATAPSAVEWGVTNVEAPRVWSEYGVRGEGVVVASIDSGAQFDHPALVRQYRGNLGNGTFDHNYNWFDPQGLCATAPCDRNGHGTHTTGTAVGDDGAGNQIGVAPGARWIAVRGCQTITCADQALLDAAQFVLAPTDLNGNNPRPDLHANVVNNSWGGGRGNQWYEQSVNAWVAAGIFPVFAAGNSGPSCGSAESPGDYARSYAVGAYDVNNAIAGFSSRGPSTLDTSGKPNIAAPGVKVRSSVPGNGYDSFNGTSMAAPHVTGAVALLWSAAPSLTGKLPETAALLDRSATDVDATGCGGTVADNNTFGEGRLNAYKAVAEAPRDNDGRVVGTVTEAGTGKPLAGVQVRTGTASSLTGPDGRYWLGVSAGEHTLTASRYGYVTQTATITVPAAGVSTQDFALAPTPTVRITGRVTDGSGKGWPLYAKIEVAGRPGGPVFTNPVTGRYSFDVAAGSEYRFTTTAQYQGYRTVVEQVAVTGNTTHDIAVPVDPACTAAGYLESFDPAAVRESFDAGTLPNGWRLDNATPDGGWTFTDDGVRGNLTGGAGKFAIVDSDHIGRDKKQDSALVTPPLDFTGKSTPQVRFRSDYRQYANSKADVDVSVDGGTTWTSVWHYEATDRRGPRLEVVPLDPAAGKANVRVRFRYQGTFAWWWQLDDIELVNRTCVAQPGGQVVGFVTDRTIGGPLNGVKVSGDRTPGDKGVSVATPDDPAIEDGFYRLVSGLTGSQSFTASQPPYQAQTKTVEVVEGGAKQLNFALASARLEVNPGSVTAHVPLNASRRTTVTVKNTGTAPAEVNLFERPGTFDLLGMAGVAAQTTDVAGITKGKMRSGVRPQGTVAGPAAGTADPTAWSRVGDYPNTVFDNVAAVSEGKVYSLGGGETATERKAYRFDPVSGAWSALPDLPVGRAKPAAAFVGGKLYVLGGWTAAGELVSTVDVYDPATNAWTTLAGVTNPTHRAAAGWGVANGKIYIVGGCSDGNCTASTDVVVFDPVTRTFRALAPYPQLVAWLGCGGINETIYCAGGASTDAYRTGYKYDAGTEAWTPIAEAPLDLWGSQFSAAGGLLVLAGGVTNNSRSLTNAAVGYDPATNTWRTLPNAQFAYYRGAGACGAYKIGGAVGNLAANNEVEHLAGLAQCDQEGDVPWLAGAPATFTLNPGQSRTITVTVSATAEAGVYQPGKYTAQLGLRTNSPYQVPTVAVTMNVTPPGNWGKIQGVVLGQPCTGKPAAAAGATVRINLVSSPDLGYSLRTDPSGGYALWLPAGRYEVIVAKDGWVPQVRRVKVEAGFVLQSDLTLAPFKPC